MLGRMVRDVGMPNLDAGGEPRALSAGKTRHLD